MRGFLQTAPTWTVDLHGDRPTALVAVAFHVRTCKDTSYQYARVSVLHLLELASGFLEVHATCQPDRYRLPY
jgi:hypothetical protein